MTTNEKLGLVRLIRLKLQGYQNSRKVGFQLQKKQNLEFQIPKKATIYRTRGVQN